jgi:regulator of sigma D
MDYHNKPVDQAYAAFLDHIEPVLRDFFSAHIKEQEVLVKAYRLLYRKLPDSKSKVDDLMTHVDVQHAFRKKLYSLLEKHQEGFSQARYGDLVFHVKASFQTWLHDRPETVEVCEPYTKYLLGALRNPLLYPKAAFLNIRFEAVVLLRRLGNSFRKLFRKKPIDLVVYRTRKVPFQSVLTDYLHNGYWLSCHQIINDLLKQSSRLLMQLWEVDERLDAYNQAILQKEDVSELDTEAISKTIEDILSGQKEAVEKFNLELSELGLVCFKDIDDQFSLVDTLYVPSHRYGKVKAGKVTNRVNATTAHLLDGWSRSYLALLDDWTLDVEITLLYFSVFDAFHDLQGKIDGFIETDLRPSFKSIEKYLSDSRQRIEACESTKKSIREVLLKERSESAQKLVDKSITRLIEKLTICFTSDFDKLMDKTQSLVGKVSKKRFYIKARRYDESVTEGEVEQISPSELLHFEALSRFESVAEKIKDFTDAQLEDARAKLIGMSTVWDFSLESALLMLDEAHGSPKKAVQGALEGADRAVSHLKEAQSSLDTIRDTIHKDYNQGIIRFNEDIQKLKNTENVFELNLKIARIKAFEKSRQLRKEGIQMLKDLLPVLVRTGKGLYIGSLRAFRDVKARIGFVENKKYVTFELSEFINETQEVLKKLPFVYQRLFQLTPTDESRFFVNREKELGELKQSLVDWQKDRFVTVAIIGDKGSGVTSLLNYFIATNDISLKIDRETISQKLHTKQQYLDFFSQLFQQETFESNQAIIEYLNKKSERRMVVLENLHHLYLKEVNGFDNLQRLFELMSNTMKKILWIGAITEHVWAYLSRTIYISNYFTNEVLLTALSPETLEEIITRRNKISGFRLNFIPEAEVAESKAFAVLSDTEKQQMLRKNLFKKLSRLSYGNISLAQLYWLRLTREVKDNTIDIGYFKEIDFSFIKELSAEELFVMQTIILHDGLLLEDFAKVMDKTEAASKNILVPMLEKGLLIRPRQKYNINPIIFNPVVSYLQSRNFIG